MMSKHFPDKLGNTVALEGCDRCDCGSKYWEDDRCVDCGTHVSKVNGMDNVSDMLNNLTPKQEKALDAYANLWFQVEKQYHDRTGEWLQR